MKFIYIFLFICVIFIYSLILQKKKFTPQLFVFTIEEEKKGGKKNSDISAEIKEELFQFNHDRVKKYLENNDIDKILKDKNISSVEEFFEKEKIGTKTFLTGLQKEILQQSGKKKLTPAAMKMSDHELYESFLSNDSIFL